MGRKERLAALREKANEMREAAKRGAFVVSELPLLFDHIEELEAALIASPAAAEMLKQLPNAMRLRTKETDDLRAALAEALDGWKRLDEEIADELNQEPREAERRAELRKLLV